MTGKTNYLINNDVTSNSSKIKSPGTWNSDSVRGRFPETGRKIKDYIRYEMTPPLQVVSNKIISVAGFLKKFVTGQKEEQKMPIKIQGDLTGKRNS